MLYQLDLIERLKLLEEYDNKLKDIRYFKVFYQVSFLKVALRRCYTYQDYKALIKTYLDSPRRPKIYYKAIKELDI